MIHENYTLNLSNCGKVADTHPPRATVFRCLPTKFLGEPPVALTTIHTRDLALLPFTPTPSHFSFCTLDEKLLSMTVVGPKIDPLNSASRRLLLSFPTSVLRQPPMAISEAVFCSYSPPALPGRLRVNSIRSWLRTSPVYPTLDIHTSTAFPSSLSLSRWHNVRTLSHIRRPV
jgi:hypothetical protein